MKRRPDQLSEEIRFSYAGRKWIAREWISSEDETLFWKLSPENQGRGAAMPGYAEYLRAVAHFENA